MLTAIYVFGKDNALTVATFSEDGEIKYDGMLNGNNKRKALIPSSVVQTGYQQVINPIVDKKGFGIAVFDL